MSDTMTGRERLLKALKGEPTDRPSVISACQYATYELMDAVGASWPEAHRDAELMATLSGKGGAEVIGLDAIRAPYCQTIEAEALGAKIKSGGKTHIPSIAEHPYKVDDVPEFPDDFLTRGRVPVAVKAVSLMKEKYGDQVLVMGGIGGPFSIANSLIGITPFLKAMFKTPDKIQPFLEMGYQAALTFGKAYIEAGADAIVIEDMMASLDMISPKNYRQLAQPYEKKLIAELGVPVIVEVREGLFEGGDFMFLDEHTIALGMFARTDKKGFEEIKAGLAPYGYEVLPVPGPEAYLHLDMCFNLVDDHIAVAYPGALTEDFKKELAKREIEIVPVPEEAIFAHGCNLQAIGDHRVLSLARNTRVNEELRKRGMTVIELPVTEILKAGGGPHCMTFPLVRI